MNLAHHRLSLAITSWPFLLALAALLINDGVLKAAYPGVITGKLSDFAGMAVVALPLYAVLPGRTLHVSVAIAGAFLWWKSPASASVVHFVRALGYADFGRTVDYTDLLALATLPLCNAVAKSLHRYAWPWRRSRALLFAPVAAITLLGVMGTSVVHTRDEYTIRNNESMAELQRQSVVDAIDAVATKHGMRCKDCAQPTVAGKYAGNGITLSYKFKGPNTVAFNISAMPTSLFFGETGSEKAESLRRSLKSELATRFRGLEYVEPSPAEAK